MSKVLLLEDVLTEYRSTRHREDVEGFVGVFQGLDLIDGHIHERNSSIKMKGQNRIL